MAGASHIYRDSYSAKHESKTLWESAATSTPCAELCLKDARETGEDASKYLVQIVYGVIKVGQVDMLDGAHQNGFEFGAHHFHIAAQFGNVCVLEWAEAKPLEWYSSDIVRAAAKYGHTGILEWVVNCVKCREMPRSLHRVIGWRANYSSSVAG